MSDADADADDIRRLASRLPYVEEIDSDGFDFRVGNRGFVRSYPERVAGRPRATRTDIAVVCVGDEAEKQALLLGEPDLFLTTPAYDGVPLVVLRLDDVGAERLTELITDAWRMRAPAELAADDLDLDADCDPPGSHSAGLCGTQGDSWRDLGGRQVGRPRARFTCDTVERFGHRACGQLDLPLSGAL